VKTQAHFEEENSHINHFFATMISEI